MTWVALINMMPLKNRVYPTRLHEYKGHIFMQSIDDLDAGPSKHIVISPVALTMC